MIKLSVILIYVLDGTETQRNQKNPPWPVPPERGNCRCRRGTDFHEHCQTQDKQQLSQKLETKQNSENGLMPWARPRKRQAPCMEDDTKQAAWFSCTFPLLCLHTSWAELDWEWEETWGDVMLRTEAPPPPLTLLSWGDVEPVVAELDLSSSLLPWSLCHWVKLQILIFQSKDFSFLPVPSVLVGYCSVINHKFSIPWVLCYFYYLGNSWRKVNKR